MENIYWALTRQQIFGAEENEITLILVGGANSSLGEVLVKLTAERLKLGPHLKQSSHFVWRWN
jgi:hypothetical protein